MSTQLQEVTPLRYSIALFKKDPRHSQILYHISFLLFGVIIIGWEYQLTSYLVIISSALITQLIFTSFTTKNYHSLKSAMITGLGLCLLLKGNSLEVLAFASFLAIASKFIIRFNGTHYFNPANFGIIVSMLITNQTWVSPGQWGQSMILAFLLLIVGINILSRVNRLETIITFIVVFCLLEYFRTCLYLGWTIDVFIHKILNGSFLLFAFFMITDPVTTPRSKKARVIWATILALLTFILTNWFFVHTAPIWALFFIAPLTVVFNKYMKSKKFQWIKN